MQKYKTSIAVYLDTHPKKNGLFPIKLRLTYQRAKRYYPLNIDLSKDDFETVFSPKPKGELKEIRQRLDIYQVKAREIIAVLPSFTFEAFNEIWYGKKESALDNQNVFVFIEERISKLIKEERIGSSKINGSLLSALKAFRTTLKFSDITVVFLKELEVFLLHQRKINLSTIGIYLREFRIIVNLAIREKIIPQSAYPFAAENNGYIIPTGIANKTALTIEELNEIRSFTPFEYKDQEDKARDFFVFSCLSNGINFSDLCLLKHSNIQDNSIVFLRKKTKNKTRSKPIIIKVPITKPMQEIMDKWGNQSKYPDEYIFTELKNDMDAIEKDRRTKQFIKTTNKYIKRIQEKLGINKQLTTMVARHTFATILLRKGASKEFLKEGLGHTYLSTTENYTHGFDNSEREKWANALLN